MCLWKSFIFFHISSVITYFSVLFLCVSAAPPGVVAERNWNSFFSKANTVKSAPLWSQSVVKPWRLNVFRGWFVSTPMIHGAAMEKSKKSTIKTHFCWISMPTPKQRKYTHTQLDYTCAPWRGHTKYVLAVFLPDVNSVFSLMPLSLLQACLLIHAHSIKFSNINVPRTVADAPMDARMESLYVFAHSMFGM